MTVEEREEVSPVPASFRLEDKQKLSVFLFGKVLEKSAGAVVKVLVPEPAVLFPEWGAVL